MLTAAKVKTKPSVLLRNSELWITTDADGLSSDQVPSNSKITSSTGPLEKALKVYDEDNIKWVTTTSLMDPGLTVFPAM
jgi:hypothetical protein